MNQAPLIYLIGVMYLCPDLTLIFVGVCWYLHTHGWGWSADESQCKSLGELAARSQDRRLGVAELSRQAGQRLRLARIGETGIWIHAPPRRIHCGLPTQALPFSHSGGGLQHQHLVRGDRETANFILWLLGSSRARSIEHDNCCSQS